LGIATGHVCRVLHDLLDIRFITQVVNRFNTKILFLD
jgi:hypothetical protein